MTVAIVLGAAALGAVLGATVLARLATRVAHDDRGMRGWRHPAVGTVLGALAFGTLAFISGLEPVLAPHLVFAAAGVTLTMTDAAEHRIPNIVLGPSLLIVATLLVVTALLADEPARLLGALLGAAAYFGVLFLMAFISPRAMGMGDVKLALLTGLLLGYNGLTVWAVGFVAAFLIGGILAVVALLARRVTLSGSLPFGPPMLLGAVLGLAWPG